MARIHSSLPKYDADGQLIARPSCWTCRRPQSHCLCSLFEPFNAHCNILILQHPHERKKYYSTARLVTRSIINSKLIEGIEFPEETLKKSLKGKNPYLLYPGPDAKDCKDFELSEDDTVIVLDGTWSEAGKILHRNPFLRSYPKISFNTALKSNYKIRKQPKDHYLSTLESIGHFLEMNSQTKKQFTESSQYRKLFSIFSTMVDRQLAFFPRMQVESASKPPT